MYQHSCMCTEGTRVVLIYTRCDNSQKTMIDPIIITLIARSTWEKYFLIRLVLKAEFANIIHSVSRTMETSCIFKSTSIFVFLCHDVQNLHRVGYWQWFLVNVCSSGSFREFRTLCYSSARTGRAKFRCRFHSSGGRGHRWQRCITHGCTGHSRGIITDTDRVTKSF